MSKQLALQGQIAWMGNLLLQLSLRKDAQCNGIWPWNHWEAACSKLMGWAGEK